MPKIKWVQYVCENENCKKEYEVNYDKLVEGKHFECLKCGNLIPLDHGQYEVLKRLTDFNNMVMEIEKNFIIDLEREILKFKPGLQKKLT